MKITLNLLSETEAIYIRDALRDKAVQLRTRPNDTVISEQKFLDDPDVSERRKANYFTLKDMVNVLQHAITGTWRE